MTRARAFNSSLRSTKPKPQGLDWDALRAKYRERRISEGATDEELAREIIDDPGRMVITPPKKKKAEGSGVRGRPKGSPRMGGIEMDPHLMGVILGLWEEGLATPEIAKQAGCTKDRVTRYLRAQGKEPRPGVKANHRYIKGDGEAS